MKTAEETEYEIGWEDGYWKGHEAGFDTGWQAAMDEFKQWKEKKLILIEDLFKEEIK